MTPLHYGGTAARQFGKERKEAAASILKTVNAAF